MSHMVVAREQSPMQMRVSHICGLLSSFMLSAVAAVVLIAGTTIETFNPVRLGAVLVALILLHLLRYPRFVFRREFALYAAYLAYMVLSLFWTPDVLIGTNTLLPAVNFVLILILFGSLVTYHPPGAALAGILGGFLVGAVAYTLWVGFPFVYPQAFSYNAIAGMYLFGLFITLVVGWWTGARVVCASIGLVLLILIAATTSIKTNLGILLGVAAVALLYSGNFAGLVRRNAIPLVVLACIVAYAVVSNEAIVDKVHSGVERVALGVEILSARGDVPSGTSYEQREYWMHEGLRGWSMNPLFGFGVEAFRTNFGITSHSTPIDLLYNTGIIGFVLFYSVFASIAHRLFRARDKRQVNLRALLFGAFVCYLFISISGTMHYNSFLAVYVAISTSLLALCSRQHAATEADAVA